MLLFDGVDDFLEHGAALCTNYPYTMLALVAHTFENSVAEQVVIGQGSTTADAFHTGGFVDATEVKYATDRSAANGTVRADKTTAPQLSATVPQWLIVHFASASDRRVAFGSSTFVTDTTAMTTSISTLNRCLVGAARRSSGLLQFGKGSFGEAWWLSGSLPSTTQLDELIAGTRLPENLTGVVDGWYLNAFEAGGTYTSHSGTRTMTASGGVSASGITHPISRGPAAPTLSSPTVVSTGNGIATVGATTDTPPTVGTPFNVRTRPAADPAWTEAQVNAAPTQSITSGAAGARTFNLTGLPNGVALRADYAHGASNVVSTASFTPSTVPGAPTIGTAVAGNAQATVNGTAPASNGGAAITGYRSTATPGGSTVTGASLPITHTGLSNGTAYTFTLAAQNTRGYGAESAASNSVTPAAPGTAPTITVQPSNQTVTAGATATFSVTATGSGLTYQWRRNGTPIGGATSSSYTTPATTVSGGSANNGDLYSVVVTGDTAPAATSSNATLTVNAAPAGLTLTAVATDATGSADYVSAPTRLIIEPLGNIENWGTGSRTISTTVTAVNGEVTLPALASGRYSVLQIFPATGATVTGVALDIVTVP